MTLDRTEATGAAVALLGHAALVAAFYYLMDRAPEDELLPKAPPSMQVSFVDEVGITSSAPTTEPSAASSAPELGPPEEAAPAEADPVPEPTPEPAATPAARPAPAQRPTQQRSGASASTPARQQTRPAEQSGAGRRRANRGSDISSVTDGLGDDPATPNRSVSGATVSQEARARIDQALLAALRPCQRQAVTTGEAGLRITVRVTLSPERTLAQREIQREVFPDNLTETQKRQARQAALNIAECLRRPVPGLQPEHYNVPRGWRTFRYIFPES